MPYPEQNPLSYDFWEKQQESKSKQYIIVILDDITCYLKPGNDPARHWKIILPTSILNNSQTVSHCDEKPRCKKTFDDILQSQANVCTS